MIPRHLDMETVALMAYLDKQSVEKVLDLLDRKHGNGDSGNAVKDFLRYGVTERGAEFTYQLVKGLLAKEPDVSNTTRHLHYALDILGHMPEPDPKYADEAFELLLALEWRSFTVIAGRTLFDIFQCNWQARARRQFPDSLLIDKVIEDYTKYQSKTLLDWGD